jgi:hypothetical protein
MPPAHETQVPLAQSLPATRFPKRALAAFLFTVILGPPLGMLPMVFGLIVSRFKTPRPSDSLSDLASMAGDLLAGAYMLGLAPAAVAACGIAAVVWRQGTIGYLQTAFVAAGALLFVLAVVSALLPADRLMAAAGASLLGLPLAIVSAFLGRWLVGRILPRLFN